MSKKIKSPKNKTIDFTLEQGQVYVNQCLFEQDLLSGFVESNLGQSKEGTSTEKENAAGAVQSKKEQCMVNIETLLDQVIIGDSFSVCKHIPPKQVDLLLVDPPYNLHKDYHGNRFGKTSAEQYTQYTKEWIEAVLPLLKPTASIYVCCDWESSLIIGPVLTQYFTVRNRITWQREKGRGAKENWKNGMEDIWFCTLGKEYTFNLDAVKQRKRVIAPYRQEGAPKDWQETPQGRFRDTCPSNFWDDISIPYWSMPENTAHPTQKPEKLMAKLILASSNPGDVILDPFSGSGSSLVTAKKLKRHFIGIEQNPLYGAWTQKRLEMAETDSHIQGYVDQVFWERNSCMEQNHAKKQEKE